MVGADLLMKTKCFDAKHGHTVGGTYNIPHNNYLVSETFALSTARKMDQAGVIFEFSYIGSW